MPLGLTLRSSETVQRPQTTDSNYNTTPGMETTTEQEDSRGQQKQQISANSACTVIL